MGHSDLQQPSMNRWDYYPIEISKPHRVDRKLGKSGGAHRIGNEELNRQGQVRLARSTFVIDAEIARGLIELSCFILNQIFEKSVRSSVY